MAAKKNTFTFGSAGIDHISPKPENITEKTKAINVVFSYEEALKLHMALQNGLLELVKLNRSTKAGKAAGINLCVFLEPGRVAVNPEKIKGKK